MTKVFLNQIETAVPTYECHAQFLEILFQLITEKELKEKLEKIVQKLGIEKRYTVLKNAILSAENSEVPFYQWGNFPSTEVRMRAYQKEALPLACRALEPLLKENSPQTITHLILTSCTGFYAPGLDIEIIHEFNLNRSIERNIIGYMGCYAAITALRSAYHIVRSNPKAKVLMLNLELCTLHWREKASLDQVLSHLLFADGCAASLISAETRGFSLERFFTAFLPDSLDHMRWTIGDDGFYMTLDSRIPNELKHAIKSHSQKILHEKNKKDFNLWAIHPGGSAILDAVQEGFDLEDSALKDSREVLKQFGNMSSPTVMFVLKRLLENPNAFGWGSAIAFGPGLTLESFIFHRELKQ